MKNFVYAIYDYEKDRFLREFHALHDDAAREEFELFYRVQVPPKKWRKRKLGRYVLLRCGDAVGWDQKWYPKPVFLMDDGQVRASFQQWVMADPPRNDAEFAALSDLFAKVDAEDLAFIAKRGNSL